MKYRLFRMPESRNCLNCDLWSLLYSSFAWTVTSRDRGACPHEPADGKQAPSAPPAEPHTVVAAAPEPSSAAAFGGAATAPALSGEAEAATDSAGQGG